MKKTNIKEVGCSILPKLISLLFVFVFIISALSSCVLADGKSAYEIAVDNGFKGSESEWLESLKGSTDSSRHDYSISELYEFAVANGYTGTAEEFALECANSYNGNDHLYAVNKGLLSSVSVYSYVTTSKKDLYSGEIKESTDLFSTGSGVIIDIDKTTGDAYIITNFHVIYYSPMFSSGRTADAVKVYLYGMEYTEQAIEAIYIGGSVQYDIAVIKVSGSELLKNSHAVAVTPSTDERVIPGQDAIAIGNPASGGISATSGIVSIESDTITLSIIEGYKYEYRVMRIDTAVNSGNSGGGLFNAKGELIGIVNAKITHSNIENIGYAIPSDVAISVARNIIRTESDSGYKGANIYKFGITFGPTDAKLMYDENTKTTEIIERITIDSVEVGSAAEGKLREGDVLKSIKIGDNEKIDISRAFHFTDAMIDATSNDHIVIVVERAGKLQEITFDLSTMEPQKIS